MPGKTTKVVILGGGFAGAYVAKRLLQLAQRDDGPDRIGLEVHLVTAKTTSSSSPCSPRSSAAASASPIQ